MKLAQQNSGTRLLDDLKRLVDSLPLHTRKELVVKEVFAEFEDAAPCGADQGARVHAS